MSETNLWADAEGYVPICSCDRQEFDHFRRTDCPEGKR